jgi:hypothetical protein
MSFKALIMKEAFFFEMNIFLHEKNKFLYYREDDMPDMVRIDNSLLKYQVTTLQIVMVRKLMVVNN